MLYKSIYPNGPNAFVSGPIGEPPVLCRPLFSAASRTAAWRPAAAQQCVCRLGRLSPVMSCLPCHGHAAIPLSHSLRPALFFVYAILDDRQHRGLNTKNTSVTSPGSALKVSSNLSQLGCRSLHQKVSCEEQGSTLCTHCVHRVHCVHTVYTLCTLCMSVRYETSYRTDQLSDCNQLGPKRSKVRHG